MLEKKFDHFKEEETKYGIKFLLLCLELLRKNIAQ